MTEENLNVVEVENKKECDCPICTFLRSKGLKKFGAVVLASFIGCSLAILAFAPKKHYPHPKRPHPPVMRTMDRPMPPQGEFRHFDRQGAHPEFRGEHQKRHEFRGENGPRRHDLKSEAPRGKDFRGGERKKPDCKCKELNRPDKNGRPLPTPEPQAVKAE